MGSPTGIGEPMSELIGIGEPMYSPTGTGKPIGKPDELIDQFYSSYN